MSWNLDSRQIYTVNFRSMSTYPVSVLMVAAGFNSCPCPVLSRARSQSSKHVSLLKSTSTAPDLVPVAIQGLEASGDHANVAVLGISRRRTIVGCVQDGSLGRVRGNADAVHEEGR